jgi:hypothetical protein
MGGLILSSATRYRHLVCRANTRVGDFQAAAGPHTTPPGYGAA